MATENTTSEVVAKAISEAKSEVKEPQAKKIKTGWEGHTLNCSEALKKADEGRHLADLSAFPVAVLQGIGMFSAGVMDVLKLRTVQDLAEYKYYHLARALTVLAETETDGGRPSDSVMNVDKAVVAEYEGKTFREIIDSPVSALEGLTDDAISLFESMGVKSVRDLGRFKFCRWAEAIVLAGKYEFTKTDAERKQERLLKKLE